MKELSIEEKAKAYDGLIERLKDLQFAYRFSSLSDTIEEKFPELRESEDWIPKEIIKYLKEKGDFRSCWIAWLEKQGEQNLEWSKEENDKISNIVAWIKDYPRLAKFNEEAFVKANNYAEWLKSIRNKYIPKKQGEQKPIDLVAIMKDYFDNTPKEQQEKDWEELKHLNDVGFGIEIPFGAKDSELQEVSYYIPEGFHAEIESNRVVIKRGKQKLAWSEEDERKLTDVIVALSEYANGNIPYILPSILLEDVDWLKDLKDRVQLQNRWKPSDEQMDALESAIVDSISSIQKHSLESLYNELKKLF